MSQIPANASNFDPARRQSPRMQGWGFHFLMRVDGTTTPYSIAAVALMDISAHGCGLYQVDPLPVGTKVGIHLFQHGEYHTLLAEVRHSHTLGTGWTRIGLLFLDTPPDLKARLASYASSQVALPKQPPD